MKLDSKRRNVQWKYREKINVKKRKDNILPKPHLFLPSLYCLVF